MEFVPALEGRDCELLHRGLDGPFAPFARSVAQVARHRSEADRAHALVDRRHQWDGDDAITAALHHIHHIQLAARLEGAVDRCAAERQSAQAKALTLLVAENLLGHLLKRLIGV